MISKAHLLRLLALVTICLFSFAKADGDFDDQLDPPDDQEYDVANMQMGKNKQEALYLHGAILNDLDGDWQDRKISHDKLVYTYIFDSGEL